MLVLTIVLATILMVMVVTGLSIGLIFTGKSRLRRGCGLRPEKKENTGCSICGDKRICESDKKDDTHSGH